MYVPTVGVAIWQVYVAVSAPNAGPDVEVHEVAVPPVTVQVTEPVGAGLGETPVTTAVKVIGIPTVVVVKGEEARLIVGVTLARLIGKIAEVAVR